MLAIASFYDYEIWQMDVKTASLNGYLKEELYMMQPEGFVYPKGANKVCKCYLLRMRWFSLEEERVMQQSSVSISLSFLEPRYQSSRRLHSSSLVPAQTNKNLATNAIKGLSIPSRSLTRVRSDRANKINIFGTL